MDRNPFLPRLYPISEAVSIEDYLADLVDELGEAFSFSYDADASATNIGVTINSLSFHAGGESLATFSGSGNLTLSETGIHGEITLSLDAGPSLAGLSLTVSEASFNLDTREGTQWSVVLDGALEFGDGYAISGAIQLRHLNDPDQVGAKLVLVDVSSGSLILGNVAQPFTLNGATGRFLFSQSGLFGDGEVDVDLQLDSFSLNGTFGMTVNTFNGALSKTLIIDGEQTTISAEAGPSYEILATNAELEILNNTISGSYG
ncbi:MAG: hypothetical protein ACO3VS_14035, partial [Limisphaerales bacterium]